MKHRDISSAYTAQGGLTGYSLKVFGGFVPMPRKLNQLSAALVKRIETPGLYSDGGGLFLQVTKGSAGRACKSWVIRFRAPSGHVREMGLGSALVVTLAKARTKAADARVLVADGIDPIEQRKAERVRAAAEASKAITFREASEQYIERNRDTWKNAKHRQQWTNSLEAYAYPVMGNERVDAIGINHVLRVIEPIWEDKTETADRVRGRIERVLDWAAARELRTSENPARWKGKLEQALTPRREKRLVRHHPALPYAELPAFMATLRARSGMGARALEFVILTAARTGEVLGATWGEFDLVERMWTVPAVRMKSQRDHRVPLSPPALKLLRQLALNRELTELVFPSLDLRSPLSSATLLSTLRRMRDDLTVHGFRSSFRDWAAEQTDHPREVAEAALAHVVGDKAEAAYRRSDLFNKRCLLMDDWALFCAGGRSVTVDREGRKRKHSGT